MTLLPSPQERALAHELASIRREIERVKSGNRSTQMDYSSIMGPLYVRDPITGDLIANVGIQPDGGVASKPVGGPPPRQPTAPVVTPIMAGADVYWDGTFVGAGSTPTTASGERLDAARLILARFASGEPIFEDWTWVGAPAVVLTHNDPLLSEYNDQGTPQAWLTTYINSQTRESNFAFVAVHVSGAGAGFITDASNLVGTLTEAGSLPVAPLTGPQWVRLVGYNTSTPPVTGPASVTVGPIQPAQVVAQAVLDGIVTEAALADQAVSQLKVKLGAIGTGQLAGNSVTLAQLADGSVDGSKILGDAIAPVHISLGAVTGPAIAAESVSTGALSAGAVTAGKVATNTLTAAQIAASAIGTDELAANSVIAGKVGASAITANELAANSVGAAQLVAGAVQAGKIAAGAVTAATVAAGAITAGSLAVNAVTAGAIQAGSVTGSKFASEISISNRFIAGNPTGTRGEMNGGGFEAWAGSLQTFDVDASTGNVMMLGAYKTAASGTRIELGGSNGADVIRLYQGNVYGEIFADPAPGGTAGVFMAGSGTNRGKVVAYPGEAATSWVAGTDSRSAISCLADATNIWGGNIQLEARDQWGAGFIDFQYRNTSGVVQGARWLRYEGAGSGEPALRGVNQNVKIVWSGGTLYVQDNAGNAANINALNVAPSSRTLKKNEGPIDFGARTALDIIKAIDPKRWNYNHEWTDGEPAPEPQTEVIRGEVIRDDTGKVSVDSAGRPLREPDRVIELPIPRKVKPHFGFIAEDVAAVAPDLVHQLAPGPEGMALSDRDMLAVLWKAFRMAVIRLGW